MQIYKYSLVLHEDSQDSMRVGIDGDWQMAYETAMYYSNYYDVISFYDYANRLVITLTREQINNKNLIIEHQQEI